MEIVYSPLTMADSAVFYHLAGDERVAATMRFDCPHTQEESDRILADYLSQSNRTFALRSPGDPKLWGVFAFKGEPETGNADLSQMLLPEQWGRGLGNQIISDMVTLARKNQWYRTLGAYILESNIASRRMVEKCAFHESQRFWLSDMNQNLIVYTLEL